MSSNPFLPWWYYEMGKDAAKHPNREISNWAFVGLMVILIIALILFGIFVAVCVWYFTT